MRLERWLYAVPLRFRSLFRRDTVEGLIKSHEERRFDHSARLWALLMLELWLKEWGAGTGSQDSGVRCRAIPDSRLRTSSFY